MPPDTGISILIMIMFSSRTAGVELQSGPMRASTRVDSTHRIQHTSALEAGSC